MAVSHHAKFAKATRQFLVQTGPIKSGMATVSTYAEREQRRRRRQLYDRILRVNHAGELGADRIYAGQMAVLGSRSEAGAIVQHMWEQEKEHLRAFEKLLPKHRARPTALMPLWNIAGFALGASELFFLFPRYV